MMLRDRAATVRRRSRGDGGHEAVGEALLISLGVIGMVAAARLAEASVGGLITVMNALQ